MDTFDINGNSISVAQCKNCLHEVNADCFDRVYLSGIILSDKIGIVNSKTLELNELEIIDNLSKCCIKPYYYFKR